MNRYRNIIELGGRVLISAMFLMSGVGKISAYAATAGYMASKGVPGVLLPLVIATEIVLPIAIIIGYQTRIAAFLLAGFTMLAALIFHSHFSDQMQMINFWKNVSITGGFMLLVFHGAGPLSLDQRIERNRNSAA